MGPAAPSFQQPSAPTQLCQAVGNPGRLPPMSLSHCPLCVALAVLSTMRGLSLALLAWQLIAPLRRPDAALAGPVLPVAVPAS
jgi:hypothetical protein